LQSAPIHLLLRFVVRFKRKEQDVFSQGVLGRVSRQFDSVDSSGSRPFCILELPHGSTRQLITYIWALQRAVAKRTFAWCADSGCGLRDGPLVTTLRELDFSPVGVDATGWHASIARSIEPRAPWRRAGLTIALFRKDVFDCISDITVVQHIPYSLQPEALREMVRVLKRAAKMILFELIREQDCISFPDSRRIGFREVESRGATLLVVLVKNTFLRSPFCSSRSKAVGAPRGTTLVTYGYFSYSSSMNRFLDASPLLASATHYCPFFSLDGASFRDIFPISTATHGLFVFRKKL